MSVLANYEPKNVFSYFEKLCTIPAVQAIQMVWHPTW